MYRHITGAASLHFKAATWWAWSSWVKFLCITLWSTALQLQWPWNTAWLLVWWFWCRRWLTVALRLNRIFLTLVIPLHLACYSLGNKAYLMSDNNCTSAHLLCYKHQQNRQPDEHNVSNKDESRLKHYSLAQELGEWWVVTSLKNR